MKWLACWAGGEAEMRDLFAEAFAPEFGGRVWQIGVGTDVPASPYWAARLAFARELPTLPADAAGWFLDFEWWRGRRGVTGPLTRAMLSADLAGLRAEILYGKCEQELGRGGVAGVWWGEPGLGLGACDLVPCYPDALDTGRKFRAKVTRRLRAYLEQDGYDPRRLRPFFRAAGDGETKTSEILAPGVERAAELLAGAGVPEDAIEFGHWIDVGAGIDRAGVFELLEARAEIEGRAWSIDEVYGLLGGYAGAFDGRR